MNAMRLPLLTLVGAIGLAATSLATAADSFTAGVLACAAESDRDRRLECYDRAVAGYTAALAGGKRDSVAATGSTPASATRSSAPAIAAAGPAAVVRSTQTVAAAGGSSAPAVGATATEKSPGSTVPRHLAARISSIDHFPDYVVLHLDNQQTWKQVSDSPGGLALRNGDPVTIDRQMGSFWLAGPKGAAVQVRLEGPPP